MSAGASPAFALIRVPRGTARPSEEQCRAALKQDLERLHQPTTGAPTDVLTTGPHPITVDGAEIDEYVVWER